MLTFREMIRFIRLLPARVPRRIRQLYATSGKLTYVPPPDDFDQTTGLDTGGIIHIYKLDSLNKNYTHAQGYQPILSVAFRKTLNMIPIDYAQFTFIDLGCGKGRALFLACEFGFKRIVGVELSPLLVQAAKQNLSKWHQPEAIEIVCADASQWEWPNENLVVFFYNPFDGKILSKVIENLRRSITAQRRDVWLIYFSPLYRKCLDSQVWLNNVSSTEDPLIYHVK